ncbi:hypothetical protein OOZ15_11775 [Galbibacter sp. EGI 63066]|uniref:hypothetical protein n=1 Tax=Galbibacter sp. EGI 63066 TaxID=2993559 RepID=UPI0022494160|nr:hypothetical protein [Galbibacter sp. EGI 63066]MCX2680622.1 hypothetical protein [Galbibacter sp. EGI 63066]
MKKFLLIVSVLLYQTISFSQTTYSGILNHTSNYFTIQPYNATYDDGTHVKIYYDGNNKRLNFLNSDDNTSFTRLRAGIINGYGLISVLRDGGYRVAMNGQSDGYITGRNDSVERKFLIHSNGNSFFNGGNVGIGTDTPSAVLEVNKSINNIWSTKIINGGGQSLGLLIKNGYGGSQSTNYPRIMQLEDGNGNIRMKVQSNGKIGMNTDHIPNGYVLAVGGKAIAEEVKVVLQTNWSDFVFEKDYDLPTLEEVEQHIKEKGHLKDVPSAKEVEENGIYLGEMDAKLLQKIEELMLYTIEQQKRIEKLEELVLESKKNK